MNLESVILGELADGPLPAKELYGRIKKGGQARTAVSRLVRKQVVFHYKLLLGAGNRILSIRPPRPHPPLIRLLYANDFFGRPALKSFLRCLATSHQVVSLYDIAKMAALKVGTSPGNWSEASTLADSFEELGLLIPQASSSELTWIVNHKLCIDAQIPFGSMNANLKYQAIRNRVRHELNESLAQWLRKNTLFSDSGAQVSSITSPVVSLYGVPFDIVGFCFTRGIALRRKGGANTTSEFQENVTASPMIGDCLLEECNLAYAESFFRRVRETTAIKGKRYPVPFIFAKTFESRAFTFLKRRGILLWTHSQFLGAKTAAAIERFLSIAESIVAQQQLDPQLFAEVFEGFENFQGLFGQLKGKLFELLMAYYFQGRYSETQVGWEIETIPQKHLAIEDLDSENSRQALEIQKFDVDVAAYQDTEAALIECKGIKKSGIVEESEVFKHFSRRVPTARAILLNETRNRKSKFKGIVITTGNFDIDAVAKHNSGAYKARLDTTLELWDRTKLLAELRTAGQSQLIEVIEKYYR